MIKTFRGILEDGGQDRIRLQTIKGKVGYRIVKLELIPESPMAADGEHVIKIYIEEQSTLTATVNFTDSSLLAAATIGNETDGKLYPININIIFDRETFNQDIYLTHVDNHGATSCNYYLELEVIPLDDAGAEYTTLKDLRQ